MWRFGATPASRRSPFARKLRCYYPFTLLESAYNRSTKSAYDSAYISACNIYRLQCPRQCVNSVAENTQIGESRKRVSTSPSILDDILCVYNIESVSTSTTSHSSLSPNRVLWEYQKWGVQRRGVDQPWYSQILTTRRSPGILKVGRAGTGCRPA